MKNPFSLKIITNPNHFCNRAQEIDKLVSYASSDNNIVIYSPRRFGKTSLLYQVQQRLAASGFLTTYIDLFGLSSADNIAKRIAKGVYSAIHKEKNVFQKAITIIKSHRPVIRPDENGISISAECVSPNLSGADLLDRTLAELGEFIVSRKKPVNVALDEFQEITEIRDPNIEGIMRAHIQNHHASYFFVGSRRRVLLEMFTQRRRPFFQSAITFELPKLPHDEMVDFLVRQFAKGGKQCSRNLSAQMAKSVEDHPYYCQKLGFFCFELAGRTIKETDVKQGLVELVQGEQPVFEAIIQGLAAQQIALLKAIANEPSKSIMSMGFIKKHGLKSIGGIQSATKKLGQLDLIHKEQKRAPWAVVDPVFRQWLANG